MDVQYEPTSPVCTYNNYVVNGVIKVTRGRTLNITCNSTSNPSPPSYTWTLPNSTIQTGARLSITDIQPSHSDQYRLLVWNSMTPTGGTSRNGTSDAIFTVDVQYEPTTPVCTYSNSVVTGVIMITRGSTLNITCNSISNPSPPTYTWTLPGFTIQTGASLLITGIQPSQSGQYRLMVWNSMTPTGGASRNGTSDAIFTVDVQYEPTTPVCTYSYTVLAGVIMITRGSTLNMTCNSTSYPSPPTYTWTLPDFTIQTGASLNITDIQPSQSGQYRLLVWNSMTPTGGASRNGTSSATFTVDVQYEPTTPVCKYSNNVVTGVIMITRGSTLSITCNSTSNPSPPSYMWTLPNSTILAGASLNMTDIQPSQSGQYRLLVWNSMTPTGGTSRNGTSDAIFTLDVQYEPTTPVCTYSYTVLAGVIMITRGSTLSITCNSTSYPSPPTYTWTLPDFTIQTGASLNITDIQPSQSGQYRLLVWNSMTPTGGTSRNGTSHAIFIVDVQSKPDIPRYFHYTQNSQNQSSVKFYWLPGYNGEYVQTFYIELKKTGSQVWDQVSVVEDPSVPLMISTVYNLSPATEYQARMFARNKFGDSDTTYTVTFTTLDSTASASHQSVPQVGSVVGGVVGGVVILVVIAGLVYLRLNYNCIKKGTNSDAAVYENLSSRNEITNRIYEGLTSNFTSTGVYSTLQDPLSRDNRITNGRAIGTNNIEMREESAYQNVRKT